MTIHPKIAAQDRERAFALDGKAIEDGDKPIWIQIARVGQWAGHPSGPFQLSPKHFDEMVRAFKNTKNQRIPYDFEHASEMDPRQGSIPTEGAPAQGWALDLDNRGEAGLWALTRWLEPAKTYIREEKYRWVSPTIRFNARDPETGLRMGCRLSSIALTNQPFLDGMAPVAAKDVEADDTAEGFNMLNAEQIQKLLEEKAALSTQVTALSAKVTALETDNKKLTEEAAATSLTLKDVEAKLGKSEEKLKTLSDEKAKSEAKVAQDRVDLAFSTYKDEKNLTDADKEAMAITLSTNPALFDRLYPKAEAGTPHLLRNLTSNGEDVQRGKAPDAAKEETIVQLADRLVKETPGLDKERAFVIAERQIRARNAQR